MTEEPGRTWDGHPISPTPPTGAMIVVIRQTPSGPEYLLLHRAHHGPEYEGPWAWGPPSGARYPREDIDRCAARELFEETGITANPRAVEGIGGDWPVYVHQAPAETAVHISAEHDKYRWLPFEEAAARIRPEIVRDAFSATAQALEEQTS